MECRHWIDAGTDGAVPTLTGFSQLPAAEHNLSPATLVLKLVVGAEVQLPLLALAIAVVRWLGVPFCATNERMESS